MKPPSCADSVRDPRVLLALLLPGSVYSADQSPFVTVLSKIGVSGAGDVMNLVVLTAAMSSLNSGLYSTGRILRSTAMAGSAPKFTARMNRSQVPYGGIPLTCAVCVLGVGLNYLMPSQAFEIVLNVASLGIISTWVIIMVCHLVFVRRARAGLLTRPSFRLKGSPVTEIATVAFLLVCLGMMWNDPEVGRKTLLLIPVIALLLVAGWFGCAAGCRRPPTRSWASSRSSTSRPLSVAAPTVAPCRRSRMSGVTPPCRWARA